MKRLVLIACAISFTLAIQAQDRPLGNSFITRSEVIAQNGMAATSQPLATQVALDILKMGGNAVDAAIAANAVIGLMEPTGNGIGGDLFAIIWDAESQRLYGLNASGRSPASLSREWLVEQGHEKIPYLGALSVSVPGAVDGWFEMHEKFGFLPMDQILQPAIAYAREGFPVSEIIAHAMMLNARTRATYPGFSELFMPDGKMPVKGEVFKNPQLASTFEAIARGGRDAFYKGDIARTIASFMQENGGFLSYEDLANHASEWVEPVSTNYRGYDVWELPPNGQGVTVLQMLNILEGFNLRHLGYDNPMYMHAFIEAKKLAFEDRAKYFADPAFVDVPVEQMISKEYAHERRLEIDLDRAAKSYDPGLLNTGETIYLTVADKAGNMVSLIQSNYGGMGSGMTPPGLGFVLQNRGALFSLEEGHPNAFEPNKRPFHTIIPAFITKDGEPFMSFGVMGGAYQPQGHCQIIINMIDFEMNLQEAGDAPRFRHIGSSQPTGEVMSNGGTLLIESGFSQETIRDLMSKGHKIQPSVGMFGGYQAIMLKDGVYYGASESRKDGQAAGY